jgi:putative addiction module component (TIGR02574 family)
MTTQLEVAEAEAMKLSPEERADLADRLWLSVNSREEIKSAWDAEIEHRIADMEAGRTTAIPGEQVFAGVREMIGQYRKT